MIALRVLGCTAVGLFILGLVLSDPAGILYKGQDAAGRGMFSGLVFAFFGFLSFVVSFVAFVMSFLKKQGLDRFTLVLARGPFALLVLGIILLLFWNPY
jgi:hypothetical protein